MLSKTDFSKILLGNQIILVSLYIFSHFAFTASKFDLKY